MRILLTGANGYIGRRILPVLAAQGHTLICLVRDPRRFQVPESLKENVEVVKGNLLQPGSLAALPTDFEAAYYLVHSMGAAGLDFYEAKETSARHFAGFIGTTDCRQIIYLSGITSGPTQSRHLRSRRNVEEVLRQGSCPVTVLQAAVIIGSGSASFEIIRDLVEKLPLMIAPRWLNSRCQPIAIRDVVYYLTHALNCNAMLNRSFEIGGPDVLTYKNMLLQLAKLRGLNRYIISTPFLSTRLSSLWLYFITSTSFRVARSLAESLHSDVVVHDHSISHILPHKCLAYTDSLRLAFTKIEQNEVVSSWTDAVISGRIAHNYMDFVQIPEKGVFRELRIAAFDRPPEEVLANVWSIGGSRGWYHSNLLWRLRGMLDKLVGGVGLYRPRRNPTELRAGDSLDFWRVLLADRKARRLLLYAEMKLPGEAWLQFSITEENGKTRLEQLAAFRPNGLAGRLYWYAMLPFHALIFKGMVRNILRYPTAPQP